jgi:hypothetical protein
MMRPATTHERLEELGRRIDALVTRTQAETEQTRLGSQDRVAALRKAQAAARATVHDAAASAEEAMLQLDARVTIAERSAATDIAEDLATVHRWAAGGAFAPAWPNGPAEDRASGGARSPRYAGRASGGAGCVLLGVAQSVYRSQCRFAWPT